MPSAIIASGNYSYGNSDIPEGQFPMKHGRFNRRGPGESEAQLDWRRSNVTLWGDVIGTVVTDDAGKQSVTPRSSRQAIDGTIRFLRERTGLAEFLARLAQQAQEQIMKALLADDTEDTDEAE